MKNRKRETCTSGSVRDEDGQPPHLLGRRNFLHLAAGAAALPAVSRIARAQVYPTRPVRLVVGYAPGGAGDISMRVLGQWLSERFGQQFVVENRTGAGTNIATEAVVRAVADGYTLLMSSAANAINATLYDRLNFNFIRDTTPISGIMRVPHVIVVHPSFSAKTLPEFIAYARANPGQAHMGFTRRWNRRPCLWRAIQDDGRSQHGSHAVSRRRSRDGRPAQRSAASVHRRHDFVA
jgi:hypothetical protein